LFVATIVNDSPNPTPKSPTTPNPTPKPAVITNLPAPTPDQVQFSFIRPSIKLTFLLLLWLLLSQPTPITMAPHVKSLLQSHFRKKNLICVHT
jgi:hypothetical protein